MPTCNWRYTPSTEFRFFVHDPDGDDMRYFRTAEERDAAAHDAIMDCLDDGWSEGVDQIIAGEVTHHTIRYGVETPPQRDDFDEGDEGDDDFEQAVSEYGGDWPYKCSHKLAPLSEVGEPEPTTERARP